METITQFRLPNGSVTRLVDWVDKPIYSTLEILTGATDRKISAFTYNVGEPVPATANAGTRRTSTEIDTNVDVGGAAASTEEILVYAIKPEYFELQLAAATPTDMTTASAAIGGQPAPRSSVLSELHLRLKMKLLISQKAYVDAGLGYFNTGFGSMTNAMLKQSAATDANVRSYATAGLPSQEAVRTFAVPHHVGGTEKYQVVLINPAGTPLVFNDEQLTPTGIARCVYRIRIYLDGMRKRPTA